MKLSELIALEKEMMDILYDRAQAGDNDAAAKLLEHLRAVSKNIEEWRQNQPDIGEGKEAAEVIRERKKRAKLFTKPQEEPA